MYCNKMMCGANNCAADEGVAVAIPAGEACAGLCGEGLPMEEETLEITALPVTIVIPQSYVYGFCASEALQRGTLFPELVG